MSDTDTTPEIEMTEEERDRIAEEDRRSRERVRVLWLEDNESHTYDPIYVEKPDDPSLPEECVWGLVYDISARGARMWLSKQDPTPPEFFEMKFYPPDEAGGNLGKVRVERVWMRNMSAVCYEVGVSFIPQTPEVKAVLTQFVEYFKNRSDKEQVRCALIFE